ncbi:MAG TPA: glycosyltransferase [Phycisphaerae bacterium]|nr:glycosyltransferase [Phycisphaerae bacterium]HUX02716.1 glycosyltransferase [Phycisphaerae bacterium]
MNVTLLAYTNRTSGIGVIAHGLFKWLPAHAVISIRSAKGQDAWTPRQANITAPRPPLFCRYLKGYETDVLLSVETMWDNGSFVHDRAAQRHIRTACIIMHEEYSPGTAHHGLFLCPTRLCFNRVTEPNKAYFELPIEIEPFPFTLRTQARRFLHVMGFGAHHNRRQTREVVAGFLRANIPGATLTVHCCQDPRPEYGQNDDPRVHYRRALLPDQAGIYADHDILIQTDSYVGFGLPLLEAQACGMPVITTNAAPMNEQVRDPDALVPVDKVVRLETRGGMPTRLNCDQHIVTAEGVAATITRLAAGDIRAKSELARVYAESRAWTEPRAEELRTLLRNIPK